MTSSVNTNEVDQEPRSTIPNTDTIIEDVSQSVDDHEIDEIRKQTSKCWAHFDTYFTPEGVERGKSYGNSDQVPQRRQHSNSTTTHVAASSSFTDDTLEQFDKPFIQTRLKYKKVPWILIILKNVITQNKN